ncbi:hypothetical protein VOLCADRAFT_96243 [Volvox carteri f. nagariensis]|uniref:Uncharacterized protein n=1 Tax=Volvox carteri f. nagariensis TaxID=3068 RepID=D8U9L2_VOLCA|nr:uncharacterized protein VOLCADRAFT_96243 [Volvox carteri f. nagariensis]EFJ43664.1 hypothetical protein VOLCADRAFT_96243 [Volvox carteri f. nagariensis]|eukprot:XP_002955364.1 hypothetical protein VOLCADRAFT_96243 [Volvox carteri f. nagariensis]
MWEYYRPTVGAGGRQTYGSKGLGSDRSRPSPSKQRQLVNRNLYACIPRRPHTTFRNGQEAINVSCMQLKYEDLNRPPYFKLSERRAMDDVQQRSHLAREHKAAKWEFLK